MLAVANGARPSGEPTIGDIAGNDQPRRITRKSPWQLVEFARFEGVGVVLHPELGRECHRAREREVERVGGGTNAASPPYERIIRVRRRHQHQVGISQVRARRWRHRTA